MPLIVRPQTPADFPAIARLETEVSGYPTDVEEVAAQAATNPQFVGLVAELDGRLLGRAAAGFMHRSTPAGDLRCVVVVDPAERRRGVGRALWDALQPPLAERRPAHLRANGNPADPESVAWAQRRGFVITHHLLNQQLDLQGWAPPPDTPCPEGFRFVPFTAIATPDSDRRLHALYQEYLSHTPDAAEAPYMAFEPWRTWAFESEGAWPEGWIIAVAPNGGFAGFSLMQKHGGSSSGAHVYMTGVSPAYRGHGLGLALKVAATEHAVRMGITHLTTLNHAANQRILAINRKLGFAVTQEILRMVKACDWPPLPSVGHIPV